MYKNNRNNTVCVCHFYEVDKLFCVDGSSLLWYIYSVFLCDDVRTVTVPL